MNLYHLNVIIQLICIFFSFVYSEILTNAIRDCLYPVDFSIYSTCPRAMAMDAPEIPVNYPIHYDSLAVNREIFDELFL